MREPLVLGRLQEWLAGEIVTAGGSAAGAPGADAVIRSSAKLAAGERLELYRRSHRLRLLAVMRSAYPGLRLMLGDELFGDFALAYLAERPSGTRSFKLLTAGFATYLAATRAQMDSAEAWPDMIVDLARLERVFAEVYDAKGVEGEQLPGIEELPEQPRGAWRMARIEPVRCLRLVRSSFPAGPYLIAVRRGEEPSLPAPRESFLAVSRRDYVVTLAPLSASDHALLDLLARGMSLDAAAATAGLGVEAAWQAVRMWTGDGLLGSLRPGRRPSRRSSNPLKEHV
jgi:hypothetical protein